VTEQNYLDPGQDAPVSQIQAQGLQRQNILLLQRIASLELQVAELRQQLILAGGMPPAA